MEIEMLQRPKECKNCIKCKTLWCPNSDECFAKEDKPLYTDAYMILEENKKLKDNWNKLKEFLENNWKETQDIWFVKIINKMRDIERGIDNE